MDILSSDTLNQSKFCSKTSMTTTEKFKFWAKTSSSLARASKKVAPRFMFSSISLKFRAVASPKTMKKDKKTDNLSYATFKLFNG